MDRCGDHRCRQRTALSAATESDGNRTDKWQTEPRPIQVGRTIDQQAERHWSGRHPDNERSGNE
jgi:hypothetical protein